MVVVTHCIMINLGNWILVVSADYIFVDECDQYLILA